MKIGELDQHCGDCGVMEYCGEGFCYCLCADTRFSEICEGEYNEIAEGIHWPDITKYDECEGCTRPDCDVYRCSETDYADEPCEHRDLSRDHFCEQVADYVAKKLKEKKRHG